MAVPKLAFFIAKYFGSGVIIATAFIHVSGAVLTSACVAMSASTLSLISTRADHP